jgi:acyl-CoA synthetase (AMP-forming)/AMP-acid ligase II
MHSVTSAHLRLISAIVGVVGCNTAERRALSLFPSDAVVDEWFSTGDIGRVDEDGYFFLVARKNI